MEFFLLLLPQWALAHAELVSSNPQEGETINQSIDTLTLQFGEEVEKFISFTINNKKGETFPVDSTNISGKTVMVLTKSPLPSGDYTAKWTLIAADGHENSGQLTFKVGQIGEKQAQSDTPSQTSSKKAAEKAADHTTLYINSIAVLAAIVLIGAFVVLRKKDK